MSTHILASQPKRKARRPSPHRRYETHLSKEFGPKNGGFMEPSFGGRLFCSFLPHLLKPQAAKLPRNMGNSLRSKAGFWDAKLLSHGQTAHNSEGCPHVPLRSSCCQERLKHQESPDRSRNTTTLPRCYDVPFRWLQQKSLQLYGRLYEPYR